MGGAQNQRKMTSTETMARPKSLEATSSIEWLSTKSKTWLSRTRADSAWRVACQRRICTLSRTPTRLSVQLWILRDMFLTTLGSKLIKQVIATEKVHLRDNGS